MEGAPRLGLEPRKVPAPSPEEREEPEPDVQRGGGDPRLAGVVPGVDMEVDEPPSRPPLKWLGKLDPRAPVVFKQVLDKHFLM